MLAAIQNISGGAEQVNHKLTRMVRGAEIPVKAMLNNEQVDDGRARENAMPVKGKRQGGLARTICLMVRAGPTFKNNWQGSGVMD